MDIASERHVLQVGKSEKVIYQYQTSHLTYVGWYRDYYNVITHYWRK